MFRSLIAAAVVLVFSSALHADSITLNFKDADINTVIETVSETTGRNFIVDPRVKGKVTVISAEPMDSNGLYQTFLSILEVHGFAAIPFGDTTKIVPQNDAKQLGRGLESTSYSDDLITRALAVQHVAAAQLVPILRPLLPQYGHLAAYAPSNILIISDRQANVDRILDIVRRIDRPGDAEVDVVTLQHANATDVVKMLQSLEKAAAGKKTAESTSFIADPRTNSVLVSGDRANRIRIRELIKHLDTPSESNSGNTNVIYLKYAKAAELAKILQGYAKASAQTEGKKTSSDVTIFADESTNSLVITAPPRLGTEIRNVIDRLDIRRAQVLVEAIIAEISLEKAFDLGFNFSGVSNAGGFILESGAGGAAAAIAGAVNNPTTAATTLGSLSGLTFGAGSTDSNGDLEFLGILRAVATDSDNNIISTPSLLAMDNQEAEISIGSEVPFVTGQFTNTGSTGSVNPFQTIERRDVGVTLKITPHVIDDGTVELEIYQEISNISTAATTAADVITNKRTIDTTVIVDNGEIIALGGLLQDNSRDGRTKVPILGSLPVIGGLFRGKSTNRSKSNLMVFIRPIVIQDGYDLKRYSEDRYKLLQSIQLSEQSKAGAVLPPLPGSPGPTIPAKRQAEDVIPLYVQPEDREFKQRNDEESRKERHRIGPRK
ncbi:MAG: type II secretion system secretin GspD [Gammaproteobacteria bacterium]|nr:type II secretion system secretin GspD [Gammaproteobacteria bacterium]